MKTSARLAAALVYLSAVAWAQVPSPSATLVIHNVTVIDTTGGAATGWPALPHRTVVVRDGKIEAVVDQSERMGRFSHAVNVNGTGKFLIPGLWDMHVHMAFGDWFPRGKEITLPLFIANIQRVVQV